MNDRRISTRELARRLRPDDPETARRAVRRYLNGMVPLTRTREEIAHAMGSGSTGPGSGSGDTEDD